ncbi:MAG: MFS transporter [Thermoleophilia bacterium]|nr:MFS transporter [Thermoleophilia bacterium]
MKRFDLELRVLLALVVVNGVAEASIVPLLPSIRDDLGMTSVQAGLVLSATTIATLVIAMPVGVAANRFGTRVPLVIAAGLIPIALLGQALAASLPLLIGARLLFGLSFGIIWVIAPARAAAAGRGASGTGSMIAASGLGWLIGPVVAGGVADVAGWRIASLVLAVCALPLVPLIARYAEPRRTGERLERVRLGAALGLVRRHRAIAGAALVSALLGVVGGVSGLLLPLALAGNGLSAGGIGLVFGISAAVWIAAAALVGRLRASAVHLRGVGVAVAVLAGAWLLPAFGLSTFALLAFLLVSTGCRSAINALNFAVCVRASSGDSAPAVVGVMNLAWAVTALSTPLLAGLADGSAGVRTAFALTGLAAAAVAVLLLAPRGSPVSEPVTS